MAQASDASVAVPVHRPKGRWNQRTIAPWLFLAPGLFMFAVYVLWPIVQSITLSFYDWDGLYGPNGEFKGTFVGLGNYAELMTDPAFEVSLWNNFYWLALYLLALPAGLFIAIFLNQTVTGIRLYKSLFFFPFVISQVVVGLMFAWFYAPNFGLFYLLTEWITGKGTAILADPDLVTFGIIAAGRLCNDPLSHGPQQRRPRPDRGGAAGWREGLADAVVCRAAATASRHLHRGDRHGHRRPSQLRPRVDHDFRRPLRIVARPQLLHV
jgi:hypothetical protein